MAKKVVGVGSHTHVWPLLVPELCMVREIGRDRAKEEWGEQREMRREEWEEKGERKTRQKPYQLL